MGQDFQALATRQCLDLADDLTKKVFLLVYYFCFGVRDDVQGKKTAFINDDEEDKVSRYSNI